MAAKIKHRRYKKIDRDKLALAITGIFLIFSLSLLMISYSFEPTGFSILDTRSNQITGILISGNLPCGTLSSSDTYIFQADVSSDDTCLIISADDIIIDCQGNSITYGKISAGYGIDNSGGYDNITIKNCHIIQGSLNADHGIYFKNANNGKIENNIIDQNIDNAIYLSSSRSNLIKNNTITVTPPTTSSFDLGILITGAGLNIIEENRVLIQGKSGRAINIEDSNSNTIRYNNLTIDAIADASTCLTWWSSTNNIVHSNIMTLKNIGSTSYIIHGSATNNMLYNNIFNSSKTSGFLSTGAQKWNTTKSSGMNIINGGYVGGNYWANFAGTGYSETCVDNAPKDGICDVNYVALPGTDYHPLTKQEASYLTKCGTISGSITYHLQKDISAEKTCIIINSDDVTLDCHGKTITYAINGKGYGIDNTGNESYGAGAGIHNGFDNVTIKNCKFIRGSDSGIYGIRYIKTRYGKLENNTLVNSGIYIRELNNLDIAGNIITVSKQNEDGIGGYLASDSNIKHNLIEVSGALGEGIWLSNSPNINITNNTIKTSGNNGYGLSLISSSKLNIENNIIWTSGSNAYVVYSNSANNIFHNNIFNTTNDPATNIFGSVANNWNLSSGNFWTNPSRTGYSDNCLDGNSDGVCDNELNLTNDKKNTDYLPLTYKGAPPSELVCGVIDSTGTYTLTKDIESDGTCISIGADNVVIDCQDNKITYAKKSFGDGINNSEGYDNIVIKNCEIIQGSNSVNSYGIYFKGGDDGEIKDNLILTYGGGGYGIRFDSSSRNTVTRNRIQTTQPNAYVMYLSSSLIFGISGDNHIYNNVFSTPSSSRVYILGTGGNKWNTTKRPEKNIVNDVYIGGNYWTNPSGTGFSDTCEDVGGDGICDKELKLNNINIDKLPLSQIKGSAVLNCGILSSPGTYKLQNDIKSDDTCITINADDIILDCMNHKINYSQANLGYGIHNLGKDGLIIKNCEIVQGSTNLDSYAVYFNNGDGGTLENNTIKTYGEGSYGAYLWSDSNSNTLSNNKISTSGKNAYGLNIESSSDNVIYNNIFNTSRTSLGASVSGASENHWSITKTESVNIIGMNYLGGNFWTNSIGTGYSNTCEDADFDGICDKQFNITNDGKNTDYLPLTHVDRTATRCVTIASPGTYTLNRNLNSDDTCLVVGADNIVVDCEGYTITYAETTTGYGIDARGYDNVTIKDCKIIQGSDSGSSFGIYFNGGSDGLIKDVAIETSGDKSYGIYLISAKVDVLGNSIITHGIQGSGLHLWTTSGSNIIDNYIATNEENGHGILLSSSSSNIIEDNIVHTFGNGDGLNLLGGSDSNTIAENQFRLDNSKANALYISTSAKDNMIYNNIFNSAKPTTINNIVGSAKNNWNTTKTPGTNIIEGRYLGGNYWTNSSSTGYSDLCIDSNLDGICDKQFDITNDGNNIDYLPLSEFRGVPPTGCEDITSSGLHKLTGDVSSDGTCIEIKSDDITLDCQGYTITFAKTSIGIGISNLGFDDVTIKNCNIIQGSPDYVNGVGISYRNGAQGGIIQDNTIRVIGTTSIGLDVTSSSNINIENNLINGAGNGGSGINVFQSSNLNIKDNELNMQSDNKKDGLSLLLSSNSNNVTGNTIKTGHSDASAIVLQASSNNLIYNNLFNTLRSKGVTIIESGPHSWNTTKVKIKNVAGGSTIGGNYWTNPSGTGFSDTCEDLNFDSICDKEFEITTDGKNTDYLPLGISKGFSISECITLSEEGAYKIQNTLNSDGTCLIINANNVELNCQNNIINYSQASTGYGVDNTKGYENLTIKNCNIVQGSDSGSSFGIYSNGGKNTILQDTIIETSGDRSYGVYLISDSKAGITRNTITTYGVNGHGIHLWKSSYSNVIKNAITTSGNLAYGIYLYDSSNTNLLENTIMSAGDGILLVSNSNYNIIDDNTIDSNRDGVLLVSSSDSNILNNKIESSGTSSTGIKLNLASSNTIQNNTVQTTDSNSYALQLISSVIFGPANNNYIYNNIFNTSRSEPIYISGTSTENKWNTTTSIGKNIIGRNDIGGNYWTNSSGTGYSDTCIDGDFDGICDKTYTLNGNNIDYLPLASQFAYQSWEDCATIGTVMSSTKLTTNLKSAGTCITIGADNVVLDCQNHVLNYSQSIRGYGINNSGGYNNLTIKNCNIVQGSAISSSYAIWYKFSENGVIENNIITTHGDRSHGARLTDFEFSTVKNNRFYIHGASAEGIYQVYSFDNNISKNTIETYGNSGHGISYRASLYNPSWNNTIIIYGKNAYGVYLYRSRGNKLYHNWIQNNLLNSYVVYSEESNDNIIYNNVFNTSRIDSGVYSETTTNKWNTTTTSIGKNIIGGDYVGGNYWANFAGTGYSETCADNNPKDGICDLNYTAPPGIDYLPLTQLVEGEVIPPIPPPVPPTPSVPPSDGGGGSGAAEEIIIIPSGPCEFIQDLTIKASESATFSINDQCTLITILEINAKQDLKNTRITIKGNTSAATQLGKPEGLLLQYFSIQSSKAGEATNDIYFTISRKWINENKIGEINVYQYTSTGWVRVPIKEVLSGFNDISYVATGYGWSVFAITGTKLKCGNGICDNDETEESCCIDCGCSNGMCVNNICLAMPTTETTAYAPLFWILFLILIAIFIAIIMVRRRRPIVREEPEPMRRIFEEPMRVERVAPMRVEKPRVPEGPGVVFKPKMPTRISEEIRKELSKIRIRRKRKKKEVEIEVEPAKLILSKAKRRKLISNLSTRLKGVKKKVVRTEKSISEEVPKDALKIAEVRAMYPEFEKKLSKDISDLRKQINKIKGGVKKELKKNGLVKSILDDTSRGKEVTKKARFAKKRTLKKTLGELDSKLSKIKRGINHKNER